MISRYTARMASVGKGPVFCWLRRSMIAASRAGVWRLASASFCFLSLPISITTFRALVQQTQNFVIDPVDFLPVFGKSSDMMMGPPPREPGLRTAYPMKQAGSRRELGKWESYRNH